MAKNIAAGIAGILIAGLLVMLIEMLGHSMNPPPPDLDFSDANAMRTYITTLPASAFLFVVAAWAIGAFGGTFAASKIGTAKPVVFACVIGGFVLAATAYNLLQYPHPVWVTTLGIAGIIGGAWLGKVLSR